ncbi:MAG: tripartite tricarboxylate transporter substrate binding protein, partial [Usitatibacter sp.]
MTRRLLAAFALAAAVALPCLAQSEYPNKPVTMIVPFPPGGVADITARPLAETLGRILKQPVIVENRAGAGGGVGMQYVARAKPDGYTLLMALSSISIIPEADKVLGRDPMFQLNQLVPIARFTADPTVLAVRADSPYRNVADLVAAAKKNPGGIPYGSSGNYGTMHVPMEMFDNAAGIKMLHVPFTGAGPAVVALLGGQVEALSTGPSSVIGHVKGGKIRVLATWGDARLAAMPDVPTLKELGYDAQFSQWTGLFAPAGTPEAIVAKLREAAH